MKDQLALLLAERPHLAPFFKSDQTVREYAEALAQLKSQQNTYRDELKRIILKKFHSLNLKIGDNDAAFDSLSSSDHHGIISYPLLINAHIFYQLINQLRGSRYSIALSCGGVPLCNTSYPRGVYYKNKRLPIAKKKWANASVYGVPSLDLGALLSSAKQLLTTEELSDVTSFYEAHLKEIPPETISFSDQITLATHSLWPSFFDEGATSSQLVMIQIEEIFSELFQSKSLLESTPLYAMLFQSSLRSLTLSIFENVPGAWFDDRGTHFFWGLDDQRRTVPLRIVGNELVCEERLIRIPLQYAAIAKALDSKEIFASSFSCYLLISFFVGQTLLGGFNQIAALQIMKSKIATWLKEAGMKDWLERVNQVTTDGLICGPKFFELQGVDATIHDRITPEMLVSIQDQLFSKSLEANIPAMLENV